MFKKAFFISLVLVMFGSLSMMIVVLLSFKLLHKLLPKRKENESVPEHLVENVVPIESYKQKIEIRKAS